MIFPVYQRITGKTGTLTGILGVAKNTITGDFLKNGLYMVSIIGVKITIQLVRC